MRRIYEQHRHKEVKYEDSPIAVLVGYSDNKLIGAIDAKSVTPSLHHSFRRYDKDHWIEQEYRNEAFRYIYVDEKYFDPKFPLGGSQSASGMREVSNNEITG